MLAMCINICTQKNEIHLWYCYCIVFNREFGLTDLPSHTLLEVPFWAA